MSYGDILSPLGPEASLVGTGLDLINGFNASDDAAQARADQLALQKWVVQQEQQRIADEVAAKQALRQRVLTRGAELDGALKDAYARLGAKVGVNSADVNQNYLSNMNRYMSEYKDVIGEVASQGYANAISRGMDRSTQFTDEQAAIARKAADQIPNLQQAAFDKAISQSRDYADTLNYGRADTLAEIGTVYGSALDSDRATLNGMGQTSYANLNNNLQNMSGSATDYASDVQAGYADAVKNFKSDASTYLNARNTKTAPKANPNEGWYDTGIE